MRSYKEVFDSQGFLHVPQAIDRDLIRELLSETSSMIEANGSMDIIRTEEGTVRKIGYLFDKHPLFLETLAHPNILGLAMALSDTPTRLVPTWEDMLVKPGYTGIPVQVHQDLALQTVSGLVFSIGIYLHSSLDNPVCFLLGSHKMGPLTREQIQDLWKTRKEDFVPVYAKPGDLVVHNVLTVHYSGPNHSPNPRYTWYLEFRDLDQLLIDDIWPTDWCLGRRKILFHAIDQRIRKGLEVPDAPLVDNEELRKDLTKVKLRIPHETEEVRYDPDSPYNHFIET